MDMKSADRPIGQSREWSVAFFPWSKFLPSTVLLVRFILLPQGRPMFIRTCRRGQHHQGHYEAAIPQVVSRRVIAERCASCQTTYQQGYILLKTDQIPLRPFQGTDTQRSALMAPKLLPDWRERDSSFSDFQLS